MLLSTPLLTERGKTHGRFEDNAKVAQFLRGYWRSHSTWASMPETQREALDQMAGKFSRILSGQALFDDHWADLAGYAELARAACPSSPLTSLQSGVMGAGGEWHAKVDN